MATTVVDTSQEWLLPAESRPPTVAELEERIDLALATARASEAAVMTVGAAALDAAEQAKRAAELAERASASAAAARPPMTTNGRLAAEPAESTTPSCEPWPRDEGLRSFHAHADRLAERLRRLQRVPLGASPS